MAGSSVGPDGVTIANGTSDPSGNTTGKLFYNTNGLPTLKVNDGTGWKPVYEAPRDGSTNTLAIQEAADMDNVTSSGAVWFNPGGTGTAFQTYVDINLNGHGKWALVRKLGGDVINDQTYNSGKYDIWDLGAHGTMTNTNLSTSSKDTLSRDQLNSLFRLNPDAGIMGLYFATNGCDGSSGINQYYYMKKVTNRSTFDAWHGMWNSYIWGDQAANASGENVANNGSAFYTTIGTASTWTNNNTSFNHQSYDVNAWEAITHPTPVGWSGTFYSTRHGPIYTDWNGGCRWVHELREPPSVSSNQGASGLVYVKL